MHPLYNQQIKDLHTLLEETANNNQIEILIRASPEQLRLEIGLLGTFKAISWGKLKEVLTYIWLTYSFNFLDAHKICVCDRLLQLGNKIEDDIFLM